MRCSTEINHHQQHRVVCVWHSGYGVSGYGYMAVVPDHHWITAKRATQKYPFSSCQTGFRQQSPWRPKKVPPKDYAKKDSHWMWVTILDQYTVQQLINTSSIKWYFHLSPPCTCTYRTFYSQYKYRHDHCLIWYSRYELHSTHDTLGYWIVVLVPKWQYYTYFIHEYYSVVYRSQSITATLWQQKLSYGRFSQYYSQRNTFELNLPQI